MNVPVIAATQGDGRYLLLFDGDVKGKGQVYDAETDTLYPVKPAMAIVARGYWDEVDVVPADVRARIASIFNDDEPEHGRTATD